MKGRASALSRLRLLPGRAEAALQSAVMAAGEQALHAAREKVPVRTGALLSSLHLKSGRLCAFVCASLSYAAFVELGTLRSAAHPYLRPAAAEAEWTKRAEKALKEMRI